MGDIYFENALDNAVLEVVSAGWAETPDCIYRNIREYHIPQCTEEEMQESLNRLVSQKKLKIMKGYYAMPNLDRRSFMRFIYEG